MTEIMNYDDERAALIVPELLQRIAELERDYGLLRELASEQERRAEDAEAQNERLVDALRAYIGVHPTEGIHPEHFAEDHGKAAIRLESLHRRTGVLLAEPGAQAAAGEDQLTELIADQRIVDLERECAELNASFELRWKADMRAITRWQSEAPGRELVWPSHDDLCVWLLGQLDEALARLDAARQNVAPSSPGGNEKRP